MRMARTTMGGTGMSKYSSTRVRFIRNKKNSPKWGRYLDHDCSPQNIDQHQHGNIETPQLEADEVDQTTGSAFQELPISDGCAAPEGLLVTVSFFFLGNGHAMVNPGSNSLNQTE
uniref:(northern house mosquito) hypothetical protein n=1 Tax=Culex pipiens TaxID=7175 RepID=A0A8D7ZT51_CULPI